MDVHACMHPGMYKKARRAQAEKAETDLGTSCGRDWLLPESLIRGEPPALSSRLCNAIQKTLTALVNSGIFGQGSKDAPSGS
jgi:hypothetical protein